MRVQSSQHHLPPSAADAYARNVLLHEKRRKRMRPPADGQRRDRTRCSRCASPANDSNAAVADVTSPLLQMAVLANAGHRNMGRSSTHSQYNGGQINLLEVALPQY
jgi:hypothetical protein